MENFEKQSRGRFEGDKKEELKGDTYESKDMPATDSYDDGLGADGKMKMPGSTSTESGGIYMEDKGPNDLRHKEGGGGEVLGELDPEVNVKGEEELDGEVGSVDEGSGEFVADDENDAAAKWLRENDPGL